MIIQNTNFKTISGKTQNYDLFKKIFLKSIISRDSISLTLMYTRICSYFLENVAFLDFYLKGLVF